ncbi:MAG: DEAD/DEAH box helicase [Bacillaceae bacterium]
MEQVTFQQYGFKPFILKAVEKLGFQTPTEIQQQIFPVAIKERSVIGQSQTGSGKTHAYLLPMLNEINPHEQKVQVIITTPTRELARQIYDEITKVIEWCEEDEKISAKCFVGGTDKQRTIEKLKTQPQIVVGTPGRIADLVTAEALYIHAAHALVVDEADLMLDMGFIREVDQVASRMNRNLKMLVFSATIPQKLQPFLKKYMENPVHIQVNPRQAAAVNIEHTLMPSRHRNKSDLVKKALDIYNPYLAIIFTNTKKRADEVADDLIQKGLKVGRIHGDLTPRERKKMMKEIQDLKYQYIVATDLAARGIDIQGISHVINVELPEDLDFYIHRVGRTARAGYSGVALTIYDQSDDDALVRLEKRGIEFKNMDIRDGEFVEIGARQGRKVREKKENEIEKNARKTIKKPSKVKPGYKKKLNEERKKFVRNAKRNSR